MGARNFARGAPPPSNSWEWAGVAQPPPNKKIVPPSKDARTIPVIMTAVRETVVVQTNRRPWLWGIAGAAVGFFIGRKVRT